MKLVGGWDPSGGHHTDVENDRPTSSGVSQLRCFLLVKRAALWMVLMVLLTACTAGEPVAVGPVDGELDCGEEQVPRSVEAAHFGSTQEDVVEEALDEWTTDGGSIENPPGEYWTAVVDGLEVARALPEQNGDGSWVVHDVTTCGEPDSGPAEIDGELDCASDGQWFMQGEVDPDAVGLSSPELAALQMIEQFQRIHGGQIDQIEDLWVLVLDGREQVKMRPRELESGGWLVTSVTACEGYGLS